MLDSLEELTLQVSHLIVRVASKFFQCFKYIYVVCILVCLYLVWFVCFHDLLNGGTSKMELFAKIVKD